MKSVHDHQETATGDDQSTDAVRLEEFSHFDLRLNSVPPLVVSETDSELTGEELSARVRRQVPADEVLSSSVKTEVPR